MDQRIEGEECEAADFDSGVALPRERDCRAVAMLASVTATEARTRSIAVVRLLKAEGAAVLA